MTRLRGEQITREERLRRQRRKESYHLVAYKNKLPKDLEEDEDDMMFNHLTSIPKQKLRSDAARQYQIRDAKRRFFLEIARNVGDTTTQEFQDALDSLTKLYDPNDFDARTKRVSSSSSSSSTKLQLEGMWISLTKPKFTNCFGNNQRNECLYKLGRMSFDMFQPSDLLCSIQATYNPVHKIKTEDIDKIERIPKSLKDGVKEKKCIVRTYDIVTPFTIEPKNTNADTMDPTSPNSKIKKPIEGLMSTYGYAVSNPDEPNRVSICFTGGSIEVINIDHLAEWKSVFDDANTKDNKHYKASQVADAATKAKNEQQQQQRRHIWGVKVAADHNNASHTYTMEEDGKLSYTLNQPIGVHDTSYIDILYLDETVRIAKSNAEEIYVFARVPYFPDE